jgi:acetoin utilization deacetylase AcuC-like enzyme
LAALEASLTAAFRRFDAELLFYIGGADPYREDQLGGLALTIEGLIARDSLVFRRAQRRGIPVAVTLAGGYARKVDDTVRIHANTIVTLRDAAMRQASQT